MYKQLAHYYDLIHKELTEDLGLILKIAAESAEPFLELGCGTGRVLLPLARVGHSVVGLDNSEEMLAIAAEKIAFERPAVQERLRLETGDMANLTLPESFGLVLISFNTLFHLEPARRMTCFRSVQQILAQHGRLMIDIENPFILADPSEDDLLFLERKFIDPISGEIILQSFSSRVEPDIQQRRNIWLFDTSPLDGGVLRRNVTEMTFHYPFPHQLEDELHQAGLDVEAFYGDYDQSSFAESSPRLIVLARATA